MHQLWIDLRGGFRSLSRNRLVSTLAITSLALAIAGNTAVFSVVSAMFLRPLPFEEAENLVFVSDRDPANAFGILIESKENFFDLRDRSESYDNLIAFTFASLGMERDAEPEPTSVMLASEGFFETVRWQSASASFSTARAGRSSEWSPTSGKSSWAARETDAARSFMYLMNSHRCAA